MTLEQNQWLILTDGPLLTVESPDLAPGLTAKLTLNFRNAGEVTSYATVIDADLPQYATISPSPSPSPSS